MAVLTFAIFGAGVPPDAPDPVYDLFFIGGFIPQTYSYWCRNMPQICDMSALEMAY